MSEQIDNKYYVPSIEEFHVGFEYETSVFNDPRDGGLHWINRIVKDEGELNWAIPRYNGDFEYSCRVKYLTKKILKV